MSLSFCQHVWKQMNKQFVEPTKHSFKRMLLSQQIAQDVLQGYYIYEYECEKCHTQKAQKISK